MRSKASDDGYKLASALGLAISQMGGGYALFVLQCHSVELFYDVSLCLLPQAALHSQRCLAFLQPVYDVNTPIYEILATG